MEWVSVKSGLPKEVGWYLTWGDNGPAITLFHNGYWVDGHFSNITHWAKVSRPTE